MESCHLIIQIAAAHIRIVDCPHDQFDEQTTKPLVVLSGTLESCHLIIQIAAAHKRIVVLYCFRALNVHSHTILLHSSCSLYIPRIMDCGHKIKSFLSIQAQTDKLSLHRFLLSPLSGSFLHMISLGQSFLFVWMVPTTLVSNSECR